VLAGLGLGLSAFLLGQALATGYVPFLLGDEFPPLFDRGHPGFSPLLGAAVGLETLAVAALLSGYIYVLHLFLKRSVRTPRYFVGLLALALAYQWVTVGLTATDSPGESARLLASTIRSSLMAAIWIVYFNRSERVRRTFIVGP